MNRRSRLVIAALIVLAPVGIYFNLPKSSELRLIVAGVFLIAILGAVFFVIRGNRADAKRD